MVGAPAAIAESLADPKESTASDDQPLDITGDADSSAERDRLQDYLAELEPFNGGVSWDAGSGVLTVRMVSDAALDQARRIIAAAGTDLSVEYVRVAYTANELNALADSLLADQQAWAGAAGIGGGFDPLRNRVVLHVDPEYSASRTLISAIEKLQDARVELELIEAERDWSPESRVSDFAPWTAGAAIDSAGAACTLGWTWERWGSGQIVGSTAMHCANLDWKKVAPG